jgi:hypothetical protein
LFQKITRKGHDSGRQFASNVFSTSKRTMPTWTDCVTFDVATFHLCGTVNRHKCRVSGSEHPHDITEHEFRTNLTVLSVFKNQLWFRETFLAIMENIALRHIPVGAGFQSDGALPNSPVVLVPSWAFLAPSFTDFTRLDFSSRGL